MSLKDRAIITLLTLLSKLPLAFNRRLGVFIGDSLWFSRSRSRQVTERQRDILRVRTLARQVAETYYASRERLAGAR